MTIHDPTQILYQVRKANAPYAKVWLQAASIVTERRKQYAGDEDEQDDPYFNFDLIADVLKISPHIRKVFDLAERNGVSPRQLSTLGLIVLKVARLMVDMTNPNFSNQAKVDTLIDLANYVLLLAGDIAQKDGTHEN